MENPHYFVFAKDKQWARDKLQSAHPVSFPSEKDPDAGAIQDSYLITQCQHSNHFQQPPALVAGGVVESRHKQQSHRTRCRMVGQGHTSQPMAGNLTINEPGLPA
ncbi:MAG TPA: hypothetical protein VN283_09180 [Thiobacillus sp.]|nr:hypothetical protein [Thiobacillus sp.]